MGIPAMLTSAFTFGIRANRSFPLGKMCKVLCILGAAPPTVPSPWSSAQLLREPCRTCRVSPTRVCFHSCWLRSWGSKLSQYPPRSWQPQGHLSSHLFRSASPSALGVWVSLALCFLGKAPLTSSRGWLSRGASGYPPWNIGPSLSPMYHGGRRKWAQVWGCYPRLSG